MMSPATPHADQSAPVAAQVSPAEAHRLAMLAAANAVHASFRERELRRLAQRDDGDAALPQQPPQPPDSAVDR
jgi:hypothetical protein